MSAAGSFRLPRSVDSSALALFRTCPQQWRLHAAGWRPTEQPPAHDLRAGGSYAAGLEALYKTAYEQQEPVAAAIVAGQAAVAAAWGTEPVPEGSYKTLAAVQQAIAGYAERYSIPQDELRPATAADHRALTGRSALEFAFAVPLSSKQFPLADGRQWPQHPDGGDFLYTGRVDCLGLVGSSWAIRDDKTTSSFRRSWAPGLSLRPQFIGYLAALRALGIPVRYALARQVALLKAGPAFRDAPPVSPQAGLITAWCEATATALGRMVASAASGRWERSLGEACTMWERLCDYSSLCERGQDQPEAGSQQFTLTTDRWNPLDGRKPLTLEAVEQPETAI